MTKPNWQQIKKEWETSKITFKDLAERHNVKLGTLKSRRSREKWSRDATGKKDATPNDKVATKSSNDKATQKKKSTSKARKNRSGNPNPKNQFTERNTAALKHGLFSRYIPRETLEIMGMMNKDDPADLIWDQIMIQYAAIVRSQQIMYVEGKNETIKELKKMKVDTDIDINGNPIQIPIEQEYEIQFAWDRQATFLNAQSRAISELRTSIRQFVDMANQDDERRLKLELMQANINKVEAETDKITKDNETDAPPEITIVDAWTDKNE